MPHTHPPSNALSWRSLREDFANWKHGVCWKHGVLIYFIVKLMVLCEHVVGSVELAQSFGDMWKWFGF